MPKANFIIEWEIPPPAELNDAINKARLGNEAVVEDCRKQIMNATDLAVRLLLNGEDENNISVKDEEYNIAVKIVQGRELSGIIKLKK